MTLEQFAARVQSIAGSEYSETRVTIRRDPDEQVSRYLFAAFTETAGWIGINPVCEDPELMLMALADMHGQLKKTDPSELRHDA